MPIVLRPLVDPEETAVLSLEMQENRLLPEKALTPGLAAHAIDLIAYSAACFEMARRAGTRIDYITDERRSDGDRAPRM